MLHMSPPLWRRRAFTMVAGNHYPRNPQPKSQTLNPKTLNMSKFISPFQCNPKGPGPWAWVHSSVTLRALGLGPTLNPNPKP